METALALLAGSLGTIVIGKLVDIVHQERQHRLALKRAYFDRRIGVAEAAVASWQASLALLQVFEEALSRLVDGPKALEFEGLGALLDSARALSDEIEAEGRSLSARWAMYFDISERERKEASTHLSQFLVTLSRLQATGTPFRQAYEAYGSSETEGERSDLLPRLQSAWTDMQPDVRRLIEVCSALRDDLTLSITRTRNAFKRYE